ncbi:MAG TPA: hypothetical protein DF783_08045, partial [Acidimicrobiaceae bacterium]|nr:hypothetical protein [Acidimicrobiaceae bacterium]
VRYGEGVFVGYRWYDARSLEPRFPFGHGLGYGTVEWGDAGVSGEPTVAELVGGAEIVVSVNLVNAGDRVTTEVVQCYVSESNPALARPPRELRGFAKVELRPGEASEVEIQLGHRAFAYYDPGDPTWVDRSEHLPVAAGGGGSGPGHRPKPGWYADPGDY